MTDLGSWTQAIAKLDHEEQTIQLNYIDYPAGTLITQKGVILLIHGFPQTSYQFRHVMKPLAEAGYRVIVPDYRGAGQSSHVAQGYTKFALAKDIHHLLHEYLQIQDPVYIVGHDIGGMIAHAFAAAYPDFVKALIWGECPLPGSTFYEECKTDPSYFHFHLHAQVDLAVLLVTGKEGLYLEHFFHRLTYNVNGIPPEAIDHYTRCYSQAGALRCGFSVYEAFDQDAKENVKWRAEHGKCKIPTLGLGGDRGALYDKLDGMLSEFYEDYTVDAVENASHYIAEENPEDFVRAVTQFFDRHP